MLVYKQYLHYGPSIRAAEIENGRGSVELKILVGTMTGTA